jgi:hypothetical protein
MRLVKPVRWFKLEADYPHYSGICHLRLVATTIPLWLDVSCAKRREIIPDGLAVATMRQIFAPETSSHRGIN